MPSKRPTIRWLRHLTRTHFTRFRPRLSPPHPTFIRHTFARNLFALTELSRRNAYSHYRHGIPYGSWPAVTRMDKARQEYAAELGFARVYLRVARRWKVREMAMEKRKQQFRRSTAAVAPVVRAVSDVERCCPSSSRDGACDMLCLCRRVIGFDSSLFDLSGFGGMACLEDVPMPFPRDVLQLEAGVRGSLDVVVADAPFGPVAATPATSVSAPAPVPVPIQTAQPATQTLRRKRTRRRKSAPSSEEWISELGVRQLLLDEPWPLFAEPQLDDSDDEEAAVPSEKERTRRGGAEAWVRDRRDRGGKAVHLF